MTFRDDREAQKHRIDALEDELQAARAEAEALREERDAARDGTAATRFPAGTAVWVEWSHQWYRATVLRVLDDELSEIHYDGWSSRWDEAVGPQRIAPGHLPAPGAVGGKGGLFGLLVGLAIAIVAALGVFWVASMITAGSPMPASATPAAGYAPLDPALAYVGEPVFIQWNGSWYAGTIVRIDSPASYFVHYDGWPDTSDELVTLDRLSERN